MAYLNLLLSAHMMSESEDSIPHLPPDSPGSSVSSRLQEEYDELLKYAVVLPNYDPKKTKLTITDNHSSFPQPPTGRGITTNSLPTRSSGHVSVDTDKGQPEERVKGITLSQVRSSMPDFGPSPIGSRDGDKGDEGDFDLEQPDDTTPRVSSQYSTTRQTYFPDPEIERQEERVIEETVYTSTIDPDVARMENVLDQWTLDLKRNVLAEFGQSKIRIVEKSRLEMQKERERFVSDKNQMVNEIEKLKELLHTYEQSIERKDQVISNLTHALHKQREKFDMLKKFTEWKLRHNDLKREAFASNLARKHYERSLSSRVWVAWHSVIENKWRQRVEKACQSKAQDVCLQLTNEYEAKIRKLNEELESAHAKIGRMNVEREKYEEAMKKAFMRGVCALNLEAMTMFHGEDEGEEGQASTGKRVSPDDITDNLDSYTLDKDYGHSKTIPQEAVFMTQPSDPVPPRIVTSQGSRTSTVSQARSSVSSRPTSATSSSHRGKVITAKVSAKVDSGKSSRGPVAASSTLAPPMASVIVERHQPVTKQTIGKAAASKFPSQQGGQIYKRLAGQGSPVVLSPHIQSVKVVD
ncbi:centrosomal protein POC5-like isoform X1 [Haliotis asinina]|uniref:centrosomal protein POC5-like isoform X1 n=2 Tax=Haliotis asinina TaxID=109174 RepID=UPI00353209B0